MMLHAAPAERGQSPAPGNLQSCAGTYSPPLSRIQIVVIDAKQPVKNMHLAHSIMDA